MDQELTVFFSRYTPNALETVTWDQLHLEVKSYLCSDLPPLRFITSVRTILLNHTEVLVIRDPLSYHILPGGRVEPGETLTETLCREILEETGWILKQCRYLGIKHFHHLTPKPENYRYPYPDFLQVIYVSHADEFHADAKEVEGYELEAVFQPIEDVQRMALSTSERIFLTAALQEG